MPLLVVCFECFLRVAMGCWEVVRDWTRGTGATGCLRFTTIVNVVEQRVFLFVVVSKTRSFN